MDNIQVGIRVRPLLAKDHNASVEWVTCNNSVTQKSYANTSFCFDHVFSTSSTTSQIYEKLAQPIVNGVMEGIHGTIFAYGQTASGKTFTMLGEEEQPGVIALSICSVFTYIQEHPEREHLIRASYLEIYNESLKDLLDPKKELRIREDQGNFVVKRLSEEGVTSPQDIHNVIEIGERSRRFGKTNANEHSSRSHTIFKLTVESRLKDEEASDGTIRIASLSLVDLAGSERISVTGATGLQLKEGASINLSLHVLGRVISKLSEGNIGHVPYRESKLTSILQPSIGGNSKTCIICTISPSEIGESISTLQFASRAKTIKNKPIVNEVICGEESLRKKLKSYEKENQLLKEKLGERLPDQERETLTQQLVKTEFQKAQLEQRMHTLENLIIKSSSPINQESHKTKATRRQTMCPSLLKRDTVSFSPIVGFDSRLPGLPVKQVAPRKSVKFASTPSGPGHVDDSFRVVYSNSTFKEHLDELEDVQEVPKPKMRGRPSFLPTYTADELEEDSLVDETQSFDFESVIREKDSEISRLQKQQTVWEQEKDSLLKELEEKEDVIRQLNDDLIHELEERVINLNPQDKSLIIRTEQTVSEVTEEMTCLRESHQTEMMEQKCLVSDLQEQLKALKEQLQVTVEEKHKVEADLDKMTQDYQTLSEPALSGVDDRNVFSLEQEFANLEVHSSEQTVLEETEKMTCLRESHQAEMMEQKYLVSDLQEQLEALKEQLQDTVEEKSKVEADLDKMTHDYQTLSEPALSDGDDRNVFSLEQEFENLKEPEKDSSMSDLEDKYSNLARELSETREKYDRDVQFLQDSLSSLQKQLASTKAEIGVSVEEKEKVVTELEEKSVEFNMLSNKYNETVSKETDLERELSEARSRYEGDVQFLQDTVSSIQKQLMSTKAELEVTVEQKGVVTELEEKSAECNKYNETVAKEAEDKCSDLERELSETRERCERDVQCLQQTVSSLQEQLTSTKAEMEVAVEEKRKAIVELGERSAECSMPSNKCNEEADLENKCSDLERELSETRERYERDVQCLQDTVSSLQEQLTYTKAEMEVTVEERKEVVTELEEKSMECKMLSNKYNEAVAKEADLENKCSDLETELSETRERHERDVQCLQDTVSSLQEQLASTKSEIEVTFEEKRKVVTELEEKSAESKMLSKKYNETVAKEADLENKCSDLERELSETRERHERDVQFQDTVSSLQEQLTSTRIEMEAILEQKAKVEAQLEDKTSECKVMSDCRWAAQREMEIAEGNEYRLEQEIEELQTELKKRDSTLSNLEQTHQDTISSLREQLTSTKAEMELAVREKDLELAKLTSECKVMSDCRWAAQREMEIAEGNEYRLEQEIEELQTELKAKNSTISELKRQYSEIVAKEANGDLEDKCSDLQRELSETRERHERDVQCRQDTVSSLQEQLTSTKAEMEVILDQKAKVEAQLEDKTEECKVMSDCRWAAQREMEIAEGNEYRLEQEIEELLNQLKAKDSAISELEQKCSQTVASKEADKDLERELSETRERYERDVQCLQDTVSSLQEQLTSTKAEMEAILDQKAKVEAQLEDKTSECKVMTDCRWAAQREMEIAEGNEYRLEQEIEELQTELKKKDSIISSLELKISETLAKVEMHEQTITNLRQTPAGLSSVQQEQREPLKTSDEAVDLKCQLQNIAKMRTDDQRKHRVALEELKYQLVTVREEKAKITIEMQKKAAAPAAPSCPLVSGSGYITDLVYSELRVEHAKLKETSDKEREEMKRYRNERNVYRTKFLYMRKKCFCGSLEKAKNDPDLL